MLRRSKLGPWRLVALGALLTFAARAQDAPLQGFLDKLSFRGIGPAVMGGRITQFAVNPRDKRIFYVATALSGIFKTTDAGTTFEPIFDREGVAAIGAMALAPSDPEQIWVGTGEANLRGSNIHGRGVFKSLNGGKTWTRSEEHTSELQSLRHLVCRLLLEKKK